MPRPATESICIVTPHHLANNPRVIKEADALQECNCVVTVIHGRYRKELFDEDDAIAHARSWLSVPVNWRRQPGSLLSSIEVRLSRLLLRFIREPSLKLAMRAEHASIPALSAAARGVRAGLYIGHTPSGLCAAAAGAHHAGTLLGFDAEDYHPAETDAVVRSKVRQRGLDKIEWSLMPLCAYLTASSPMIADEYVATRGVRRPSILLNTFPRSMGPSIQPRNRRVKNTERARLYWFSQTIGRGRGLEPVVAILGRCRTPCDLFLRGTPERDFPEALKQIASLAGFRGQIYFLPREPAESMVMLCSPFDLGLAVDLSTPANRDFCLTNKIYTYLLAGLPVAYSTTKAQLSLGRALRSAGVKLDLEDPAKSAREIDAYFDSPVRQEKARDDAWTAGQFVYSWETDKPIVVSEADRALNEPFRALPLT
ncbi:MAG: hypothetical protein HS122_10460 [Opitutaceae bacterium]|nr:hypothetical protein [Opitutaceae bacterium]